MDQRAKIVKWTLTIVTVAWFCFMLCLSQESGQTSGIVTHHVAQKIGDTAPQTAQLSYWDQVKFVDRIHVEIRGFGHVAVFSVLAVLLVLTVNAWQMRQWFSLAFLLTWSVADEVLKLWAMDRHCDIGDIGKNMIGSILGFLAGLMLLTIQKGKMEKKHGTD